LAEYSQRANIRQYAGHARGNDIVIVEKSYPPAARNRPTALQSAVADS